VIPHQNKLKIVSRKIRNTRPVRSSLTKRMFNFNIVKARVPLPKNAPIQRSQGPEMMMLRWYRKMIMIMIRLS
jgi:predicted secreted protein